jgi:hypothetical protein
LDDGARRAAQTKESALKIRHVASLIAICSIPLTAAADRACLEGDCDLDGAVRAVLAAEGLRGESELAVFDPSCQDVTGQPVLGLRVSSTDRSGLAALSAALDTVVTWPRGSVTGVVEAPFSILLSGTTEAAGEGTVMHDDLLSPTQEPGECVGSFCCVEVDGQLICWERW